MSTKYLVIGLGLALVVLVALSRCGSSEALVKADAEPKKSAVAGSFTAEKAMPVAEKAVTTTPQESAPVAAAPPPGSPQFGPSTLPPGSGADPAGDEWVKRQRELRAKQAAADAAATPPPEQKNNH